MISNKAKDLLLGIDDNKVVSNWGGLTIAEGVNRVREIKKKLVLEYGLSENRYFFDFHTLREDSTRVRIYVGAYKRFGPLKLYFTRNLKFSAPIWNLRFSRKFTPDEGELWSYLKHHFQEIKALKEEMERKKIAIKEAKSISLKVRTVV